MTKWTDEQIKKAVLDDDLWKEFLAYARIVPSPPVRECLTELEALLLEQQRQGPKRLTFSATGHLTTCPL